MRKPDAWLLIEEALPFLPSGGVDWAQRPYAKRWSQRRLGWLGLGELLSEVISLRRPCYVFSHEDLPEDELEVQTLDSALRRLRETSLETPWWVIDASGRWVIEVSPAGLVSLEFVRARDTRLLKQMREGASCLMSPVGVQAKELLFQPSGQPLPPSDD
ncbi:MAG: hypothetical protein JKY65_15335 [Planctomycetes bacterium]|nr:hypothetical protein [Planctomycetota bacterium]